MRATIGLYFCLCGGLQAQAPFYGGDSLLFHLDRAKDALEKRSWRTALSHYEAVLQMEDVIPAEMSVWMGKALYHTHSLEKARRLFQGYLLHTKDLPNHQPNHLLVGEAESFVAEIDSMLARMKACAHCDINGYRYVPHFLCEGKGYLLRPCEVCRTQKRLLCSRCKGQGVLIEADALGLIYSPCSLCEGKGRVPCSQCRGRGYSHEVCEGCRGRGKVVGEARCDHPQKPFSP